MTDKDTTDDTEKPSRDELAQRLEQLEQTVQQMLPSRRDALKLGGTALAAGALGSAASGSASAGTNSTGQIGSPSSPVDAELEDINPGSVRAVNFNNNEITNVSSLSTGSATITGLTTGQTTSLVDSSVSNFANEVNVQSTESVGTSATDIISIGNIGTGLVAVSGLNPSSGAQFSDVVHYFRAGRQAQVINSLDFSSPATRSYGASTGTELTLSMSAGSYDISATALVATIT
jgi:hypothetical protein